MGVIKYEIGLDYWSSHFELVSFGNGAANLKSKTTLLSADNCPMPLPHLAQFEPRNGVTPHLSQIDQSLWLSRALLIMLKSGKLVHYGCRDLSRERLAAGATFSGSTVLIYTIYYIYYKNRTRSTNIKDDIKHKTSQTSHIRRYIESIA